jgi:hypothetical protein
VGAELCLNMSEIIHDGNTIGYVFNEDECEHWWIFPDGAAPPEGAFMLRAAQDPRFHGMTLEAFVSAAKAAWHPRSHYMKATCASYEDIADPPPLPPSFPEPSYRLSTNLFEVSTTELHQGGSLCGYAFIVGTGSLQSYVYWALLKGYVPPGEGAPPLLGKPAESSYSSLSDFIAGMRRLFERRGGHRLVIASCIKYAEVPDPP